MMLLGRVSSVAPSGFDFLNYQNNITTTPYTISGATLGTAASNRIIIVCIAAADTGNPTGITVAGISASLAVKTTPASGVTSSIWYALVPTGTSGDIVVTGVDDTSSIGWYAAYTDSYAPADVGIADVTDDATISIDSYENGFMIWCQADRSNQATHTATWSGTGTVTTEAELAFISNTRSGSTGSVANTGATTNGTFTLNAGADLNRVSLASWGNTAQLSYITNVSDTANLSTYTFTAVDIGGPGLIVVNLHGGQGTSTAWTVSSCTIGGVSATIHVNPSDPDSCAIASAVITSGTTADISFTATTTLQRAVVGVYRITGYQSATPVATASQTTNASTDTRTVTLNTGNNGVVVAGTSHSDARTFTWTNATENYDVTLSETSNSFSGASNNTTGGNLTITVVSAGGGVNDGYTLSAVSWR